MDYLNFIVLDPSTDTYFIDLETEYLYAPPEKIIESICNDIVYTNYLRKL